MNVNSTKKGLAKYGSKVSLFKSDKHIFIEIVDFENNSLNVSNILSSISNFCGNLHIKKLKIEKGLFNITLTIPEKNAKIKTSS